MKAADVMTRHVISIKPDSSIVEAAQLMLLNRIRGLPVLDDRGKLVGIVTEGDLLRRRETGTERRRPRWLEFIIGPGRLASEYVHTHGRKIDEVMTVKPQTITEETPLDEIVLLMERKRIKRLPVVRGDEVVGIVSRANLVQALASLAPETADTAPSDASIRERILTEVDRQRWAPRASINVIVRDVLPDATRGAALVPRNKNSIRDPASLADDRYDVTTIWLHWTTVFLVVVLWAIGMTADWLPRGPVRDGVWSTHVILGILTAFVLVTRIAWRATFGRVLPPADTGFLYILAISTHRILYVLLAIIVVLGITNASYRGFHLFGDWSVQQFGTGDAGTRRAINGWHELAANVLLLVAFLHACAALFHQYVWRDHLLSRMRP